MLRDTIERAVLYLASEGQKAHSVLMDVKLAIQQKFFSQPMLTAESINLYQQKKNNFSVFSIPLAANTQYTTGDLFLGITSKIVKFATFLVAVNAIFEDDKPRNLIGNYIQRITPLELGTKMLLENKFQMPNEFVNQISKITITEKMRTRIYKNFLKKVNKVTVSENEYNDFLLATIGAVFHGHKLKSKEFGLDIKSAKFYILSENARHFEKYLYGKVGKYNYSRLGTMNSIPNNTFVLLDANVLIGFKNDPNNPVYRMFELAQRKQWRLWIIEEILQEVRA